MIYALCAIAAVMAAFCLFGYALRGIVDKARQERIEAEKRRREDEYNEDIDRWEDDE